MTLKLTVEGMTFVKSTGVADVHGLPVDTKVVDDEPKKTLWLLFIDQDAKGQLVVRRYIVPYQDFARQAKELAHKAAQSIVNNLDDSDWVQKAPSPRIDDLEFQGNGVFLIVLGKKAWTFYDYGIEGHQPIVFKREKTYFYKDGIGVKKNVKDGDYNWSFVNGQATTIGGLPAYHCDNLCKSSLNEYLKDKESKKLLFDINIEMPVANTGESILVVVDPGGNNNGPH